LSFHVEDELHAAGEVKHLSDWFGKRIDLDGYFLSPEEISGQLEAAEFGVLARIDRPALRPLEYPRRRCYLLADRR
jgi:hypothetical protein